MDTEEETRLLSPKSNDLHEEVEESPKIIKRAAEESPEADSEGEVDYKANIAKRSRKSTERFAGTSPAKIKEAVKRSIDSSGKGVRLGEITKIYEKLSKIPSKDDALKRLHRVLFGTDGTATTRKKEIRLWNGTVSDASKDAMASALTGAKSVGMLKDICAILSLATGGDRSTLEKRILDFLVKPTGSTSAAPSKKPKKKVMKMKETKTNKTSSQAGGFGAFLSKRIPEVKRQAEGSMTAKDITDILTFEWKNMSMQERAAYESRKDGIVKEKNAGKHENEKDADAPKTQDVEADKSSDSSDTSSSGSDTDSESSSDDSEASS
jgi:hypothetical protein